MQSSLKKSLYLGLAALSFAGVAAVSTTANAKSYAKAGAYTTLKADATTRNVEATGSNALYTKPGTVKGAKVVASVKTMKTLATSKKSANYFRAYGVKTTNRGSVYYRVVTMDGKYRGYVYGGKSDTAFAGGIKSANTLTDATMPTNKTVYLTNTNKNTLWTSPKYTQYQASKVNLQNTTSTDAWTVLSAKTKTREGSLYYYVQNVNTPTIKGYVYAGGTSTNSTAATAFNSVSVKYQLADGTSVGSASWVNPDATKDSVFATTDTNGTRTAGATLSAFITASVPTGYKISTSPDMTSVKYGSTVVAVVNKVATSKLSFYLPQDNVTTTGTKLTAKDFANGVYPQLKTSDQAANLEGDSTTAFNLTVLPKLFTADNLVSADKTATEAMTAADGTAIKAGATYHYTYTVNADLTKANNTNAKYGDNIKVVLGTPVVVAGTGASAAQDSSNGNYAE